MFIEKFMLQHTYEPLLVIARNISPTRAAIIPHFNLWFFHVLLRMNASAEG